MKLVTKQRKTCKVCKKPLRKSETGRKRIYCSTGCRQKAYRKRVSNPFAEYVESLKASKERAAREKQAIKVLEELGYTVFLARAGQDVRNLLPDPLRATVWLALVQECYGKVLAAIQGLADPRLAAGLEKQWLEGLSIAAFHLQQMEAAVKKAQEKEAGHA